jgi:hypothetical protein
MATLGTTVAPLRPMLPSETSEKTAGAMKAPSACLTIGSRRKR